MTVKEEKFEVKHHACTDEELGIDVSDTSDSIFYEPSYKDTAVTIATYINQLRCFDADTPIELFGDCESESYQQLVIQLERCNADDNEFNGLECEENLHDFRQALSGKQVLLIAN